MRIHRVEVWNFRRHEHLALDLCDPDGQPRPLTLLVGANMSGKTTALDAIHLAYEAVRNRKSPAFRPELDPSDPSLRPDATRPIEIELRWSLHDGEWEAMNELEAKLGGGFDVEKAPLYRLRLRYDHAGDSNVVDAEPRNAQRALRGRAIVAAGILRRQATEAENDRIGGVLYLDQNRHGRLRDANDRLDFSRELRAEVPDSERDVVGWLVKMSIQHMKWDEATRGESKWSRVKRLFKDLAMPAELDDAVPYDDGYDLRFRRGDRTYFTAGMSSGERQLLRLTANLAFFRAERSIILIDEMELNLHARWQRALLRFCKEGAGGDNQIVASTHSDVVRTYAAPKSILTLGIPAEGWS